MKKHCPEQNFNQLKEAIERIEQYVGLRGDSSLVTVSGRLNFHEGSIFIDLEAIENLSAGQFINIYNGKARRALAIGENYMAYGFVTENVPAGQVARVHMKGLNEYLSGLTPGREYFLSSSVWGGVTLNTPTGSKQIIQVLGLSVSTTGLVYYPDFNITIRE
jgi:hypothetical protein